jgi:hypothetical protein
MTSAVPQHIAESVRRFHVDGRALDGALLALVAVLQPSDFTGLVERSLLGRLFPPVSGRWMAWAIAINDLSLGLCLVAATWSRHVRPLVLAWAGTWLFAVNVIKMTSLHAFGG